MVTGIKSFKEWFKGNEEQYTIIGGSYVKDTKDAHEKYNFKPEHLKLKGFPEGVLSWICGDEKYKCRKKEPAKY